MNSDYIHRPIAIFDSGVGGLTVAKALKALLPEESFLYFADTASSPFGLKNEQELLQILEKNVQFLKELPIKMMIIACHTACSLGVNVFEKLQVPTLGIFQSSVDLLSTLSPSLPITILATDRTILSNRYQKALEPFTFCSKYFIPCSPIERLIESLCEDEKKIDETLSILFSSIKNISNNQILLGCTHFPFFDYYIKKNLPANATLIVPAIFFAEKIKESLQKLGLLVSTKTNEDCFIVTQDSEGFKKKFDYYVKDFFSNNKTFFNHLSGII